SITEISPAPIRSFPAEQVTTKKEGSFCLRRNPAAGEPSKRKTVTQAERYDKKILAGTADFRPCLVS
ncbi:MAG: hypothetical protein ACLUFA_09555, partial [[Clostridium] leptum]